MTGESNASGANSEPPRERRGFLGVLMRGFLSLWGLGAAGVGLSFLRVPKSEQRESESMVRCGSFSSLAVGESRFVRHGSEPFFVSRVSTSEVLALSAICTHMRCVLKIDPAGGRILCPCHAGVFDRHGNVVSGPPNRPLSRYPAEVRADEIVVRV